MAEDDRADDTRPQQQDNLPHAKDNEQQLTPPSTQPSSSSAATRTPRSLRSCNANKSKLIYDLKYHPMDESLHPSQAAKRRSAHGESYEADPEDSGSDGCPTGAESEDESDSESIVTVKEVSSRKMSGKGKKRTIEKVLKGEGTRRSARTTKAVNVLYDMSVHPQDSEIEVSSEEVSDGEGDEPVSKRSKVIVQTVRIDSESTQGEEEVEQLGSSEDKGVPCDVALNGRVNETTETYPRSPSITTMFLHGVEQDNVHEQEDKTNGLSIRRHRRDSFSIIPRLPFDIHRDSLSEQLAAEAQATSPLNYDHDDQENTSESERQDSEPINHATPASLLQQKEEEAHVIKETAMVAEALYADRPPFGSAYGLGLSFMDGSNDSHVRRV